MILERDLKKKKLNDQIEQQKKDRVKLLDYNERKMEEYKDLEKPEEYEENMAEKDKRRLLEERKKTKSKIIGN